MKFPLVKRKVILDAKGHVAQGRGIATDYEANYQALYAPFTGTIQVYTGPEGGNWLRLTRANGDIIEFAHLSKYINTSGVAIEGEKIAVTGNSGAITSGPHLHVQITVKGQRVDPDRYFTPTQLITFKVAYINSEEISSFNYVDTKLKEFSNNQLGLEVIQFKLEDIFVPNAKVITDEETLMHINGFDSRVQCVALFYENTMKRAWRSTCYLVNGPNYPIMKFGKPIDDPSVLFEIGHALILYYNENRGSNPSISNIDNYDGGEQIVRDKVTSLLPYLSIFTKMNLTEKEVVKLQALEGYIDPSGVSYWVGKQLDEYLDVRIADKIKQLQAINK